MKDKEKIFYISMWGILIFYLILKILFGYVFELNYENKLVLFIANLCNDGLPFYIFCLITYTTSSTIYFMAVLGQKKPDLITTIFIICLELIKFTINKAEIMIVIECLAFMIYPIIRKRKFYVLPIIAYPILILYQWLSMICIGTPIKIVGNNVILSLLWSLDYYGYLFLSWRFVIKYLKERRILGLC